MSDGSIRPSASSDPLPWFANKEIPVLTYRINRRPRAQRSLLADVPAEFLSHVRLVLLFGEDVITGARNQRYWRLGNEEFSIEDGFISGRVGYRAPGIRVDEGYEDSTKEWTADIVEAENVVSAPFVVVAGTQRLYVAKHPSFSESTLPTVFEMLLQKGEFRREQATTDWGVDPILMNRISRTGSGVHRYSIG